MGRKTILIADDHPLVAEGIASLLRSEFDVLGSVFNGRDLIDKAKHLRPDLITLDIGMPDLNGIEAARALKECCPDTLLVCVTQQNDVEYLLAAIRAGIVGFVCKQDVPGELVDALGTVLEGHLYITRSLRNAYDKLVRESPGKLKEGGSPLTPRQREVLQMIAEGKSSKEIAGALNISTKTIEFHRASIAEVLGLHSIAELTRYALEHNIAIP
jgi:DNA-binding NarL/FixJ family response regulator